MCVCVCVCVCFSYRELKFEGNKQENYAGMEISVPIRMSGVGWQ